MKYTFELNEEIQRCSNCPCASLEEVVEGDETRDIYWCTLTGQSAGYHRAQTGKMSQCPLKAGD